MNETLTSSPTPGLEDAIGGLGPAFNSGQPLMIVAAILAVGLAVMAMRPIKRAIEGSRWDWTLPAVAGLLAGFAAAAPAAVAGGAWAALAAGIGAIVASGQIAKVIREATD